ncbi:hypothetical protein BH24ACT16_BH24ACT16_03740 [soil metagenome]
MASVADELQVARAVADTALSTEGIHSLGTGAFSEVATYGPGEKVLGVIVTEGEVEVHIVALYPLKGSVPELAGAVRDRVAPDAEGRRIDVVVEDIALEGESGEEASGDESL